MSLPFFIPMAALFASSLASGPIMPGDPLAICMGKASHEKATRADISCGAGNVPAYFAGTEPRGGGKFALEFQSHPDDGDYHYDFEIRCPPKETTTDQKTVTAPPVTSTEKLTVTVTPTDCSKSSITLPPSRTPDPGSFCTTGHAYCLDEQKNFKTAAYCDNDYKMEGCQCRKIWSDEIHHPRCNDVGRIKCEGCG